MSIGSKGFIGLTGCDKDGKVISSIYVQVSNIAFFAEMKEPKDGFRFGCEILIGSFSVLVKETAAEIIAKINQAAITLH
jgi:hypothetical protein